MPEVDPVSHQLAVAAGALTARQSLCAAIAALAADPFDVDQAAALPILQQRALAAARALRAEADRTAAPWASLQNAGAAAAEGEVSPWPGGSHRSKHASDGTAPRTATRSACGMARSAEVRRPPPLMGVQLALALAAKLAAPSSIDGQCREHGRPR